VGGYLPGYLEGEGRIAYLPPNFGIIFVFKQILTRFNWRGKIPGFTGLNWGKIGKLIFNFIGLEEIGVNSFLNFIKGLRGGLKGKF